MSVYGTSVFPKVRGYPMYLQNLYPSLPNFEYINEHNGPVNLGNQPPKSTLPQCKKDGDTNCYYRCGAGNGTRWVGPGPNADKGMYIYRTQMAAIGTRPAVRRRPPAPV